MKDEAKLVQGEKGKKSGKPEQFRVRQLLMNAGRRRLKSCIINIARNKLEFNLASRITNKAIFNLKEDDFVGKERPG